MRVSFSAIETFKQCPQKYKFKYIDKIKAPKTIEAIFGSLIHDVLKYFHSQRPLVPILEEVLNYYKDKWPSPENVNWRSQDEELSYFNQGVKILTDYYQKNRSLDSKILALETRFELPLKKGLKEEYVLSGIIDRIDKIDEGIFEIIDYKTSKTIPSQKIVDTNLQLYCYYLGAIHRWPSLKNASIKLSLYFLKHGEKLSTFSDFKQIELTKEEILLSIEKIKKSNFQPTPSSLCDWCGYKTICPMWRHQYQKDYSDKEVKKLVSKLINLSEEIKQLKKCAIKIKQDLNEYLNKNNLERLFSENGYITRNTKIIYDYDLKKVENILKSINKWQDVLSFDKKKLEKILKNLPPSLKIEIEKAKIVSKTIKGLSLKKTKKH